LGNESFLEALERIITEDYQFTEAILTVNNSSWVFDERLLYDLCNQAGVEYIIVGHKSRLGGKFRDKISMVGVPVSLGDEGIQQRIMALDTGMFFNESIGDNRGLVYIEEKSISNVYTFRKIENMELGVLSEKSVSFVFFAVKDNEWNCSYVMNDVKEKGAIVGEEYYNLWEAIESSFSSADKVYWTIFNGKPRFFSFRDFGIENQGVFTIGVLIGHKEKPIECKIIGFTFMSKEYFHQKLEIMKNNEHHGLRWRELVKPTIEDQKEILTGMEETLRVWFSLKDEGKTDRSFDGGHKSNVKGNVGFFNAMKLQLAKQKIVSDDFRDIIPGSKIQKDVIKRISDILQVISVIEKSTGIPDFKISKVSKRAIIKTYLKNREKEIFPENIVQRPLVDNPVDKNKAEKWINSHSVQLRKLAGFLADNISYINQEEFENALDESIKEFTNNIKEKPYIVLLPKYDNRPIKSNHWCYELAREKGFFLSAIISDKTKILISEIREKGIRDVVIIDDASYSGSQVREKIMNFLDKLEEENIDRSEINVHIIIPFMTLIAENRIRKKFKNKMNDIYIYRQRKIETIYEIFQSVVKKYPDRRNEFNDFLSLIRKTYGIGSSISKNFTSRTLTYFQHKIPNGLAILAPISQEMCDNNYFENTTILHGVVLNEKGDITKFVPYILNNSTPYNPNYLNCIKEKILKERNIGDGGLQYKVIIFDVDNTLYRLDFERYVGDYMNYLRKNILEEENRIIFERECVKFEEGKGIIKEGEVYVPVEKHLLDVDGHRIMRVWNVRVGDKGLFKEEVLTIPKEYPDDLVEEVCVCADMIYVSHDFRPLTIIAHMLGGENLCNIHKEFKEHVITSHDSYGISVDNLLREKLDILYRQEIKLVVVSNSDEETTKAILDILGVSEFFDRIIGSANKPIRFGKIIKKLAKDYNVNFNQMVSVGDDKKRDIIPAGEYGLYTILVNNSPGKKVNELSDVGHSTIYEALNVINKLEIDNEKRFFSQRDGGIQDKGLQGEVQYPIEMQILSEDGIRKSRISEELANSIQRRGPPDTLSSSIKTFLNKNIFILSVSAWQSFIQKKIETSSFFPRLTFKDLKAFFKRFTFLFYFSLMMFVFFINKTVNGLITKGIVLEIPDGFLLASIIIWVFWLLKSCYINPFEYIFAKSTKRVDVSSQYNHRILGVEHDRFYNQGTVDKLRKGFDLIIFEQIKDSDSVELELFEEGELSSKYEISAQGKHMLRLIHSGKRIINVDVFFRDTVKGYFRRNNSAVELMFACGIIFFLAAINVLMFGGSKTIIYFWIILLFYSVLYFFNKSMQAVKSFDELMEDEEKDIGKRGVIIIDFRNLVWATKILYLSKILPEEDVRTVSVVGKDHVKGLAKYLNNPPMIEDEWKKFLESDVLRIIAEYLDVKKSMEITAGVISDHKLVFTEIGTIADISYVREFLKSVDEFNEIFDDILPEAFAVELEDQASKLENKDGGFGKEDWGIQVSRADPVTVINSTAGKWAFDNKDKAAFFAEALRNNLELPGVLLFEEKSSQPPYPMHCNIAEIFDKGKKSEVVKGEEKFYSSADGGSSVEKDFRMKSANDGGRRNNPNDYEVVTVRKYGEYHYYVFHLVNKRNKKKLGEASVILRYDKANIEWFEVFIKGEGLGTIFYKKLEKKLFSEWSIRRMELTAALKVVKFWKKQKFRKLAIKWTDEMWKILSDDKKEVKSSLVRKGKMIIQDGGMANKGETFRNEDGKVDIDKIRTVLRGWKELSAEEKSDYILEARKVYGEYDSISLVSYFHNFIAGLVQEWCGEDNLERVNDKFRSIGLIGGKRIVLIRRGDWISIANLYTPVTFVGINIHTHYAIKLDSVPQEYRKEFIEQRYEDSIGPSSDDYYTYRSKAEFEVTESNDGGEKGVVIDSVLKKLGEYNLRDEVIGFIIKDGLDKNVFDVEILEDMLKHADLMTSPQRNGYLTSVTVAMLHNFKEDKSQYLLEFNIAVVTAIKGVKIDNFGEEEQQRIYEFILDIMRNFLQNLLNREEIGFSGVKEIISLFTEEGKRLIKEKKFNDFYEFYRRLPGLIQLLKSMNLYTIKSLIIAFSHNPFLDAANSKEALGAYKTLNDYSKIHKLGI
ncbi:MAG: HAD family hydrolase, partial [Candidatus Omnitrophica bacterium]|nr:HAD family hydrolase [Candidatus Omnitrophota bacterium]